MARIVAFYRHVRRSARVAWLPVIATALSLVLVGSVAWARPLQSVAAAARGMRAARVSRSIGYPWEGRLAAGVKLRPTDSVRYVPEYAPHGRFYGTFELVQLIERAAARVARRLPGAKLSVGELSRAGGGEVDGHGSHEAGRDVDIAFYMTSASGEPYAPRAFAAFREDGVGVAPNESLRFDDARNWELVARLVADPDARVQYVFVSGAIRRRLLAQAARRQAPLALRARAERVLIQPARGHPHRNHFHVRVYCDPSDRPGCRDRTPFWPWYPGAAPM